MPAVARSRYLLFLAVAALGLAADLATKSWIFARQGMPSADQRPIWIVPDVLSLVTNLNEGALFGMGQGQAPLFAVLAVGAGLAILYWFFFAPAATDRTLSFALACVLAGILGNLYDRLGLPGLVWNYPPDRVGQTVYAVRDWIHFEIEGLIDWPVFNLADSLLVCGVALLFWHSFRQPAPKQAPAESTAGNS